MVSDPGSLGLAGEQSRFRTISPRSERASSRNARPGARNAATSICRPPARDDRGSLDRLTGRSACLDCREVPDLDQPGVEDLDEAVDRDQLLTNVSLYWFTRSVRARPVSSPRLSIPTWTGLRRPAYRAAGWCSTPEPIMRRFMDPQHQMAFWRTSEGGHFGDGRA